MILLRTDVHIVFLLILFGVVKSTKSLKFNSGTYKANETKVSQVIQNYFSVEDYLCVIQGETDQEENLPEFHIPVVLTKIIDKAFINCGENDQLQAGYVFISSNATKLEATITPIISDLILKYVRIRTRYILVIELTIGSAELIQEVYSSYFHNLWDTFGIVNIAVVSVPHQTFNDDLPFIFVYNPFLAPYNASTKALVKWATTADLRNKLTKRVHNVYGYPLKAVFLDTPMDSITAQDVRERKEPGAAPDLLFKQTLESHLNSSFYTYSPPDNLGLGTYINGTATGVLKEVITGKAVYSIYFVTFSFFENFESCPIQPIQNRLSINIYFIVPKAKHIESWKLYQYIFDWKVSVCLGLIVLVLCGFAALFVRVLDKQNTTNNTITVTSEIVSVMKAFVSAGINRIPTTNTQRLLIAMTLLLGMIVVTLLSAKLFALMKSKPRYPSIKTIDDLHKSKLTIYYYEDSFSTVVSSRIFENSVLTKLKDQIKPEYIPKGTLKSPYDVGITNISYFGREVIDQVIDLVNRDQKYNIYAQYYEVVDEAMYKSLLATMVSNDGVHTERINELNLRLDGRGFWGFWSRKFFMTMVEKFTKVNTRKESTGSQGVSQEDDGRVPLTFDDLTLAFYILYIGLTVSSLCFLLERFTSLLDMFH